MTILQDELDEIKARRTVLYTSIEVGQIRNNPLLADFIAGEARTLDDQYQSTYNYDTAR